MTNKITIKFDTITLYHYLPDDVNEIDDVIVSAAGVEVMRILNDIRDAEREEREEARADAIIMANAAAFIEIKGPIDVFCPRCGATPKELCKNPANGLSLMQFHPERSI